MTMFQTKPLTDATWPDFARLAEAHNGVWGGCWCMAFHAKGEGWGTSAEANRAEKEALVRTGRAHAALVYRGADCVGWCQYGSPAELPRIKARKAYEAGAPAAADWRITCFFTAKGHRGRGVAEAALAGALGQIAVAGGGLVEAFPEATEGRKVSGSFLFSGPLEMFERHGFRKERPLGKDRWLVARTIRPGA
ncbi:GNAT family N-acetyltransferase [Frigidibacter sp. RF13]|uniref:GNAT family N-acetyltransferase n=1 Tax=Frigidibacter sp. RF13 TaxID=2997340 RepID=UPI00226D51D3|nr:GNAT family N-acetyltransferase [Frigidibacter sp. RF13]MCY1127462.1 GNAT family N-acetyltransferase [Frigidibacter sp. RF13]